MFLLVLAVPCSKRRAPQHRDSLGSSYKCSAGRYSSQKCKRFFSPVPGAAAKFDFEVFPIVQGTTTTTTETTTTETTTTKTTTTTRTTTTSTTTTTITHTNTTSTQTTTTTATTTTVTTASWVQFVKGMATTPVPGSSEDTLAVEVWIGGVLFCFILVFAAAAIAIVLKQQKLNREAIEKGTQGLDLPPQDTYDHGYNDFANDFGVPTATDGFGFGGGSMYDGFENKGQNVASAYVSRAVHFHPDGGRFDFVWPSARTLRGAYVWWA